MTTRSGATDDGMDAALRRKSHEPFFRFHLPYAAASSVFGEGWFADGAETFARFFGTPTFLIAQTVVVTCWITANVVGAVSFDLYPFILLNLAFSLQAAYAAPLILLAQTRQAERDKVNAIADAEHREHLSELALQRQDGIAAQTELLARLLAENTALTETVRTLVVQVESMTADIHRVVQPRPIGTPDADPGPGTPVHDPA